MKQRRQRRLRPVGSIVLSLVMALAVSCSGDDADAGPDAGQAEREAEPVVGRLGTSVGRVQPKERARAVRQVTDTVDAWLVAAYLDGDYPREPEDFADALPGFTPNARKQAWRDRDLTTNADIGTRIDAVTPVDTRIVVDVLGTRGKPAAATARFRLRFRTEGELERRVRVGGSVRLVRGKDGEWRIFSYDVAKGVQR